MKRAWWAVMLASAIPAAERSAGAGWFRGDRACSPCATSCAPILINPAMPVVSPPWIITSPAGDPSPTATSAPVATGPKISLTSARVGPATAYEWNPSLIGSTRGARQAVDGAIFATGTVNAYQFLGTSSAYGGGFLGSGGSSVEASVAAVTGFLPASGESPELASLIDSRAEVGPVSFVVASPSAFGSTGSGGPLPADLPSPSAGPAPDSAVATASAAVPEPATILSTLVGLGMAALASSRTRGRSRSRLAFASTA